jgi:hypothetical protein
MKACDNCGVSREFIYFDGLSDENRGFSSKGGIGEVTLNRCGVCGRRFCGLCLRNHPCVDRVSEISNPKISRSGWYRYWEIKNGELEAEKLRALNYFTQAVYFY